MLRDVLRTSSRSENGQTHRLNRYSAKSGALKFISITLPQNTQDDWWRAAAIAVKLGFGEHFLQVLEENGYDIILRPYYVAIKALMQKKPDLFFNSIAAEVREPARKIMEWMKKYME